MVVMQKLITELNCLKEVIADFLSHQYDGLDLLHVRAAAPKCGYDDSNTESTSCTLNSLDNRNGNTSDYSSQIAEVIVKVKVIIPLKLRLHILIDMTFRRS